MPDQIAKFHQQKLDTNTSKACSAVNLSTLSPLRSESQPADAGKRHFLVLATGVLSTAAATAAGLFSNPGNALAINSELPLGASHSETGPIGTDDVSISFVDSSHLDGFISLGQVTLRNHTERSIVISEILPSVIYTDNGQYDINAYLVDSNITLSAGTQYHYWVKPLLHDENYLATRDTAPAMMVPPGVSTAFSTDIGMELQSAALAPSSHQPCVVVAQFA